MAENQTRLKPKGILILLAAAAGLCLIILPSVFSQKKTAAEAPAVDSYYSVSYYTENLEKRIEKLCLGVRGIDKVYVLVTLEQGSEYVYAANTKEEAGASAASDYVIIDKSDGSAPVQVTEIYPKIRGVAVVCTNGEAKSVQSEITELLSAALGISSDRIRVAGA